MTGSTDMESTSGAARQAPSGDRSRVELTRRQSPEVTTTVTTEEKVDYETLDAIRPDRELIAALERERRREKEAFDAMIQENVRLERRVRTLEGETQELRAQHDVKVIELKVERGKNHDLHERVDLLERSGGGRGTRMGISNPDPGQLEPGFSDQDAHERRLKDLQRRLERLSADDREKDRRVELLDRNLRRQEALVERLESKVSTATAQEIRTEVAAIPDEDLDQRPAGRVSNVVVGRTPAVTDSKVCAIQ